MLRETAKRIAHRPSPTSAGSHPLLYLSIAALYLVTSTLYLVIPTLYLVTPALYFVTRRSISSPRRRPGSISRPSAKTLCAGAFMTVLVNRWHRWSISRRHGSAACRTRSVLQRIFVLLAAALLCAPLLAADGRDFSAMYDFREVEDIDAEYVAVTLVLQLQNHSGADVNNAEVTLHDSLLQFQRLGSFAPLTAADNQVVHLAETFTIPRRELEQWSRAGGPRITVEYQDAEGRALHRPVELLRMPGLGN